MRESGGIESLPVVLLLGTLLAACVLGLGLKATARVRSLEERQRAIEGFNTFVEVARMVSGGGLGSERVMELELGDSKLIFDANLVRLLAGEEVLRSELIPLPIVPEIGNEIGGGNYSIELRSDSTGKYFLGIRPL